MSKAPHTSQSLTALTRRSLLGAILAGAAALPLRSVAAVGSRPEPLIPSAARWPADAASPATWRTWLLTSADELRLEAPAEPTAAELAELVQLQADRDDAVVALIQKWNSRPVVLPWTELANAAFAEFKVPSVRQSRAQGSCRPPCTTP